MDYQEIYNKASYAAINCKKDRVKANQINQLLSIFNSNAMKKIDNTLMLLMAFVMRQTSRNLFRGGSSNAIISTLKIIKNEKVNDDKMKSETREFLGLLKWFFEISDKLRVPFDVNEKESFDSIINTFNQWTSSVTKKSR